MGKIGISSPRVGPVDPDHSGTKKYHNKGSLGSTGYTQLQNMVSGPPGLSRGLSVKKRVILDISHITSAPRNAL